MTHRKVPADSAVRWIGDAVRTILLNPAPFLLMGLAIGVAALVPLLGALLLAVFGPTLYAGIVYAAREQHKGRSADFQHLLLGFQQPGKLPRLMMLCLPGLAAGLLVAMLMVAMLGPVLASIGASAATGSEAIGAAGIGVSGLLFVLLALAIGAAAYALVFFAVPRVILTDVEPVTAMRESLQACLGNAGAFLLFVGLLLVAAITLSLLLSWLPAVVGQLAGMTLLIPVVSSSLYFAYRDVYGDGVTRELPVPPEIEA